MTNSTRLTMTKLVVTTNSPTKYVLINEEDGTRWRGTEDGRWTCDTGHGHPPVPLRDFFAAHALTGICASGPNISDAQIARAAYSLAAQMMKARQK